MIPTKFGLSFIKRYNRSFDCGECFHFSFECEKTAGDDSRGIMALKIKSLFTLQVIIMEKLKWTVVFKLCTQAWQGIQGDNSLWRSPFLWASWVLSLPPKWLPLINTLGTERCPVSSAKASWIEAPSSTTSNSIIFASIPRSLNNFLVAAQLSRGKKLKAYHHMVKISWSHWKVWS